MDGRSWLPAGTVLNFPGMACRITGRVGRGSNALVYLGEYDDEGTRGQKHRVLVKELFPMHPGGAVYRGDMGEICVLPQGSALFALHRASFERGNAIHLQLLSRHPAMVGGNVNTFALNGTWYTILSCSGSVGFDEAMGQRGLTLRRIATRMLLILDALDVFHREALLHLDVSPDNVLLIPQADREHVLLIDYNSAATMAEWRDGRAAYCSIKQGYTAPEICNGDYTRIGAHSDLYSVAAIFFASLMGRAMTLTESIGALAPDAADSAYLADAPETVRHMVKRILRRGLHVLPARRYAAIGAMRQDFAELIDRIDCVGVTHSALFESAKRSLDAFVKENPSLRYLKNAADMYPLHVTGADADGVLDLAALHRVGASSGAPVVLTGGGGQGKTTALLTMAIRQCARYSPGEAAAVYVSANAYRPGESYFVRDSLLRLLRFKPDRNTFGAARHELDALLARPLPSGKPSVMILLDGLNEARGDASLLLQEVNELAKLPGVALMVASRSDAQVDRARRFTLAPLSAEEISRALGRHGLLLPQDVGMRTLLGTPLMLTMLIRSAKAGAQQVNASTAPELMDTMLRLECLRYAEDEDARWQLEAALHLALPALAARENALGRALRQPEALAVLSRVRKRVRARDLMRAFPQWIGRQKAMLGGAGNDDEWFALIVQEWLWRRTGLLMRGEDGAFRVCHQQLREHLAARHGANLRQMRFRYALRGCAAALAALALLCGGWITLEKTGVMDAIRQMAVVTYPEDEAYEVVYSASQQCHRMELTLSFVERCLDAAEARDLLFFEEYYSDLVSDVKQQRRSNSVDFLIRIEDMESNHPKEAVMPWSKADFDVQGFTDLTWIPSAMAEQYMECAEVLSWLVHDDAWYARYGQEYLALLRSMVSADRQFLYGCSDRLIRPEMDVMAKTDMERYLKLDSLFQMSALPRCDSPDSSLAALWNARENAMVKLRFNTTTDRYESMKETEESP